MRQRARELGALPTGLVRPGEVFDWPTLEPWADKVEDDKPVTAGKPSETPASNPSGSRVVPGKSEPTQVSRRPGRPAKAATPDVI